MIKVFLGKQTAQGTAATALIDIGATDFSGGEKYNSVKSETFNTLQAEGDTFIVGVENSFELPVEWNSKTLEIIMSAIGYSKASADYKLSATELAFYTVVISDSENNKKTTYKDVKVNSISITCAKGALVNGNISCIGMASEESVGVVTESDATNRGESLVALGAIVKVAGTAVTEDVDSVTIEINNNLEAKGSIDSLYTRKIRRSAPQSTTVNLSFNSYNPTRFAAIKSKAIANQTETLEVELVDGSSSLTIKLPRLFITTSERGDYKGAGSHTLSFTASINNSENTPAKFTFPVVVSSKQKEEQHA